MPWKESKVMNERMKFVIRLEEGETMSELCREFQISRKTGYKIWNRYCDKGIDGLFDESRRPHCFPNQTSEHVSRLILNLKESRPTWGAVKLREYLIRKHQNIDFPSRNTFHNILLRNNKVEKRRKRKYKAVGTNLRAANKPNDLWCADFKGQFRLGNKQYCYPLTVTDQNSRFILACDSLESTKESGAFATFEDIFEEYGLPHAIRTDNGVPFSCPNALLGLSKLSVWWLRLGIQIERIRPGKPQENGRHERMHLTLKRDLLQNPSQNILLQQEVFDDYIFDFNNVRPHGAINNRTPSEVYTQSKIEYRRQLKEVNYPNCERILIVKRNGKVNITPKRSTHICTSLAGQPIGLTEVEEDVWRVQFLDIVLGHYDEKEKHFSQMKEISYL